MKFFESFLFMTIAAASVFFTTAFACESEADCLPTEQCNIGTGCYDPCEGIHDRYLNGQCVVRDHSLMFDCIEGFQQREYGWGCKRIPHKCQSHNDCFPEQLCKDGDCFEPCYAFHDSVSNCTVIDHQVKLECAEGYITLPNVWGCIDKHSFICISNNDCFPEQLCKDGDCFDPCFEFNESVIGNCTVINHQQIVDCPEGYETRPNVLGCIDKTIISCQTNNDCPSTDRCFDDTCVDACREINASSFDYHGDCYPENHEPHMKCHDGYHNVPCSAECTILPTGSKTYGESCSRSNECEHTLVCLDGSCYDSCNDWPQDMRQHCQIHNYRVVDTTCSW